MTNHHGLSDTPAAILAGGLATRLRPITSTIPKAMVEVAGRPFIEHQIELLRRHGIRRITLCLGHLGEQVQQHLGDGSRFGVALSYSMDGPALLGTGGALRRALPLLGDLFWVLYGDSYTDIDFAGVLDHFQKSAALGLMTAFPNHDRWDRSNVVFSDGKLIRYDKSVQLPEMKHIDYGVALLRRQALERIPLNCKADLAGLYSQLVSDGSMIGMEMQNRFYEIGSPDGLQETRDFLRQYSRFAAVA